MVKIQNIIYFPHSLGQKRDGVSLTPQYLDPFLKNNEQKKYWVPVDNSSIFSNLKKLYETNMKLEGSRINIGGDHSMAIGSMAYSLNSFQNLKVVWFDAHPDINTFEQSSSKNYHGMPLSFLTGLDSDPKFNFIQQHLYFNNLLYIGIRDIDEFEQQIIDKYQIKYIKSDQFNNNFEQSKEIIQEFIKGHNVHISFDVDGIDPKYIPSTGTRMDQGLELDNCKKIMDHFYHLNKDKEINLVNIDLTEINLELGNKMDQITTLANSLHLFDKFT